MLRRIIKIDEARCNGCGLCAAACHEGAIDMVDGKAKLTREDYCDGLGDCLPACPTGAISFEEREAPAYNEAAVLAAKNQSPRGCPGTACQTMQLRYTSGNSAPVKSQLQNFPVQIKLVPVNAPWFDGAHLLIAADCTAFACGDFHERFMRGKVTLIGCPKLDNVDYSQKLTQIFANNAIQSITVVRMQVPCCGGLSYGVKTALQNSGKEIPLQIVTVTSNGEVLS